MDNLKEVLNKIELSGDLKNCYVRARGRFRFCLICLFFGFFLIALKITNLSILYNQETQETKNLKNKNFAGRADIVDRNGVILATTLLTYDLCAKPKNINTDKKKIIAKSISKILKNSTEKEILKKLNSNKNFVYLKKSVSPKEYNEIDKLGEPAIFKLKRYKRFYPHQTLGSHILGSVNIDNYGVKGVEKTFDTILKNKDFINNKKKLGLSIDIRIQEILDNHLDKAIKKHSALGGTGIILDIKKSEILAMTSLPQFNPNKINKMTKKEEFNMATLGIYELGSVFKALTTAMALDQNIIKEDTVYDATKPIEIGKYTIYDYKPKKRPLKISECVTYSSNICFAKVGTDLGEKNMKEYLKKMKLNLKAELEIPEIGKPMLPKIWRDTNVMTVSYGHGIAVSPLQFVNAFTSVINGGTFRNATLIKGKYIEDESIPNRIISQNTSLRLRKLLREVVSNKEGSGDRAEVSGYFVAGKTGTAIKNNSNRYQKDKNITSFAGFFPSYDPQFLIFVMVNEPKPIKETFNYVTGGWVAAPVVNKIISEMAPKLGILPKYKIEDIEQKYVSLDE